MKFVTFISSDNTERLGLYIDGNVADLGKAAANFGHELPDNINDLLAGGPEMMDIARKVESELKGVQNVAYEREYRLLAPVPHPPSCRDAYAFRQHVASARKNRGVDMIPEFDQFPIFYFTNHNAMFGEGEITVEKDHLIKLDFELEIAIVVGRKGRNIDAKAADEYIAGLTIMNDFSARQLQMEEMKLNLGPAKGKDFATSIGPWLVTLDELKDKKISTVGGAKYDLKMTATHNGEQVSEGNAKDMTYTFGEIIERVSYGVDIYPGDVIGSGTVGTGCYLELNGTWRRKAEEKGEDFKPRWLEANDTIELKIDGLGTLNNTIKLSGNDYSILDKKKNV